MCVCLNEKMMLDQLPTHPSMYRHYSHDFWWQFTMHCSLASSSFDGWLNHQCSPLSHNLFHTFSIRPPWIVHTFPVTSLHCSSWNSRNSPGFPPKTAQNRPKAPCFSPWRCRPHSWDGPRPPRRHPPSAPRSRAPCGPRWGAHSGPRRWPWEMMGMGIMGGWCFCWWFLPGIMGIC